jgi:hypothetical protein
MLTKLMGSVYERVFYLKFRNRESMACDGFIHLNELPC